MFSNLSMPLRTLFIILTAFLIAFASTPIVKTFAVRLGAIDVPDGKRRVHDHPIPRMGGMAIYLGFLVAIVMFTDITKQVQGLIIGSVIIVITGVFDDIMQLKWWIKLVAQFVAAGVAVAHGIIIHILANPVEMGAGEGILLGVLCIPISILWIVGITNSVNLIDGLDGLACGVSTISSLTMFAVAIMLSENGVAFILAALVGACLGFLPYNFNPAKIFMGDTGALLLGYVLATASIIGMFKFYAIISFVVPLLALALPLFDTLFAILRRVLKGQNPMTPDRGHLHHRLIDRGLSQKQAVAVLYCLSAVLGLTAVVISTRGSLRWLLVIIDAVVAAGLGFYAIKQIEHPANRPRKREEEEEESEF